MPLPAPVPGLVIRYSYLWHSEHLAGREEGEKDRPCAIVAALRPADDAGETRVLVLPVTHSPPAQAALAVEIPAQVKACGSTPSAPGSCCPSGTNSSGLGRICGARRRRRQLSCLRDAAPSPLCHHPRPLPRPCHGARSATRTQDEVARAGWPSRDAAQFGESRISKLRRPRLRSRYRRILVVATRSSEGPFTG